MSRNAHVLHVTLITEAIFVELDQSALARCVVASSSMFEVAVSALYRSVTCHQLEYILSCPWSTRTERYRKSILHLTEATGVAKVRQLSAFLPNVQTWGIANLPFYSDFVFHVQRLRLRYPTHAYKIVRATASALIPDVPPERFGRFPQSWSDKQLSIDLQLTYLSTWDHLSLRPYGFTDMSKLEALTIQSAPAHPVSDETRIASGLYLLAKAAASESLTRLVLHRQGAEAFDIVCNTCVSLVELEFAWSDTESTYNISSGLRNMSSVRRLTHLQLNDWKPYNASLEAIPHPTDLRMPTYPRLKVFEIRLHPRQDLEGLLILCLKHIPASCIVTTSDREANRMLDAVRKKTYDLAFEGLVSWSYTGKA